MKLETWEGALAKVSAEFKSRENHPSPFIYNDLLYSVDYINSGLLYSYSLWVNKQKFKFGSDGGLALYFGTEGKKLWAVLEETQGWDVIGEIPEILPFSLDTVKKEITSGLERMVGLDGEALLAEYRSVVRLLYCFLALSSV